MNETATNGPIEAPRPSQPTRLSIDEIKARIRRYNSDVDATGPTFRAAVILLAALEYGQNIDVLARRTGFERGFVARCARRLFDNGVWRGGQTLADWSSADEASGTFWNDVAVAEGKLCRRVAENGRIEWAPAGFWNKNFHFIDAAAEERLDNVYLDRIGPVPASSDGTVGPAGPAPAEQAEPTQPGEAGGSTELEQDRAPAPSQRDDNGEALPSLDRIFRDVIWIG